MSDSPLGDARQAGEVAAIPDTSADLQSVGDRPRVDISPAEAAAGIFMQDLEERAIAARSESRAKARRLERRESIIFGAMVTSGAIAILLIIAGFFLAVFSTVGFALASEAVGLLSGGGTAIFRQLGKEAAVESAALRATESEEAKTLRAIGVAAMIPDEAERNKAMADLAARLAETVGSRPSRSYRRTANQP